MRTIGFFAFTLTATAAFLLTGTAAFLAPATAGTTDFVGPPGSVVTFSDVPDECPSEATVYLNELRDDAPHIGEEAFVPPSDSFTLPVVPPGGYSVLVTCPGNVVIAAKKVDVTPSAVLANPTFAG